MTLTHKNPLLLPLMALVVMLAGGCGFQLRGDIDLTPALQTINLSGVQSGSNLSRSLRQNLSYNNVVISDSADNTVAILKSSSDQRPVTFTGTGQGAQYEVTSRLDFQLQNVNGTRLIGPYSLVAQRTYRADQNNTTASISERGVLTKALEDDLAQQLMRRLQAVTSEQLAMAHEEARKREMEKERAAAANQ
ncbi:LPS assembly lipoprotein LptE [Aestuariirhabdus sp. Z084]|uniref:LPS-assembly lipoprotein LptE n=1 Tax=Aestuariirhabdus haliotis TaxID=2918751 RepID=UPI00201B459B|nr:LPS assembly lipoprotein LptE [Aestuariirhabdus haliotis]MCL6416715.1 LPS assembly lipoprotein LptE [Aestuariirhabdus haliotis]MCL6420696.1 LPS assembly lipoprotein LptE [Aestuariirhabdus haliotis]